MLDLSNSDFLQDRVNGYYCECLDGYTGTNCEVEINECAVNPCIQGTCQVDVLIMHSQKL